MAAIEAGAGRLLPWFAVGFGLGIVLYFTAEHEPSVWAASALAIAAIVIAILLRRRPVGFVVGLGFVAVAGGFAVATLKTALIDHTVLHHPAYGVSLSGFVELREESQKTDRFVVRVDRIEANRLPEKPQRVRLSVRRGMTPPRAPSSNSRRSSVRRFNRCGPAGTISRAICISSASALRASSTARSGS